METLLILAGLAFFPKERGQITVSVGPVDRGLQVDVTVLRVSWKGEMGSGDCW